VSDRHAWDKQGPHLYAFRRCGMVKTHTEEKSPDWGRPSRWIVSFERAGTLSVGATPPCVGHLPGEGQDGPAAQDQAPVVTDPAPYIHRGGCAFCRWWSKARCTHAGYPLPLPYDQARDDLERCGPAGAWWESIAAAPAA